MISGRHHRAILKPPVPFKLPAFFCLTVFLACFSGSLSAQENEARQTERWDYAATGRVMHQPVFGNDGSIYAIVEPRHLVYLSEYGKKLRQKRIPERLSDSLAVGPDGTIYAGTKNGSFYAVNPQGGVVWRLKTERGSFYRPAIDHNGVLYLADDKGGLRALTHQGHQIWGADLPAPVSGDPLLTNGVLIVPCRDRFVRAYRSNGVLAWKVPVRGIPSIVIPADRGLLCVTGRGYILRISPEGEVLWEVFLEAGLEYLLLSDNMIITAGKDTALWALDRGAWAVDGRGQVLWKRAAGAQITGFPVWSADGRIFLPVSSGYIMSFGLDGGFLGMKSVKGKPGDLTLNKTGVLVAGTSDWIVSGWDIDSPPASGWTLRRGGPAGRGSSGRLVKGRPTPSPGGIEEQYLRHLVNSPEDRDHRQFLEETRAHINSGHSGTLRWALLDLLEQVAGSALTLQDRRMLPGRRAEAVRLLAEYGGLDQLHMMIKLLRFDPSIEVRTAAVEGMGTIAADPDGRMTRWLRWALEGAAIGEGNGGSGSAHLVHTVVKAVESIYHYHGSLPDVAGYELLLEVFSGDYRRETRQAALDLLETIRSGTGTGR
ncbi:MAG: PQQ-binding-like beta-propeller repeat protein [Spirochaetales bacterium]|nr:PQQ-binding-like beta-propeller repeat protein [Spirochaetales bacterium]MCF7937302.1 PQQ-binding-like beta-propeller repeat protein [Spirochaetales bacterium]